MISTTELQLHIVGKVISASPPSAFRELTIEENHKGYPRIPELKFWTYDPISTCPDPLFRNKCNLDMYIKFIVILYVA